MEAIDFTGPEHQAKHLARYISCPSTIRAHCVNDWGRSPDLDRIRGWQASLRRVAKTVAEPKDADGIVPRLGALPEVKPPRPRPVPAPPRPAPMKPPVTRKTLWPSWYHPPAKVFIASELVASVAEGFGLTYSQLVGKGRDKRLVQARAVVVRIMRERGWSFPRIGHQLGGRDHSTTINAARNFDIYVRQNDQVVEVYTAHRQAGWCGNAA